MKNTRKLIPAIAMLIVSAVMLTTASYAWFTMSNEAHVTSMSVQANASSSLLIVNAKTTPEVGDFQAANGTVGLAAAPQAMYPAVHDADGALKTLTNTDAVDPATGLLPSTVTPAYGPATEVTATAAGHYYDYVVALGTAGQAASGDLLATVNVNAEKDLLKAATILFLVDGQFVTDSLKHFGEASNGKIEINLGNRNIPLAIDPATGALGSYLTITMRVYFDGEYTYNETVGTGETATTVEKAYVRNANMTTSSIGFTVDFEVEEATTAAPSN